MKKAKWIPWLITLGIFCLVFFQNMDFFRAAQFFNINILVTQYQTPSWPVWVYFLIAFAVGVALMYIMTLPGRFKTSKSVKSLQETITGQRTELDDLRSEISALVRGPETPAPAEISDGDETAEMVPEDESADTAPPSEDDSAKPVE